MSEIIIPLLIYAAISVPASILIGHFFSMFGPK